jgi:hypothetical protein
MNEWSSSTCSIVLRFVVRCTIYTKHDVFSGPSGECRTACWVAHSRNPCLLRLLALIVDL